jgi:hypothetical protein
MGIAATSPLRYYLMGAESLLIYCAEVLQRRGHRIQGLRLPDGRAAAGEAAAGKP